MKNLTVLITLSLLLLHIATALPVDEPKPLLDTDKAAIDGNAEAKIVETKKVLETHHENGTNTTAIDIHQHIETDTLPKNDSDIVNPNIRSGAPIPVDAAARTTPFECYRCSTLLGDSLEDCKNPKKEMLRECGAVRSCHSVYGTLSLETGKVQEVVVLGCDLSSALDFPQQSILIMDTDFKEFSIIEPKCKNIIVSESIQKTQSESSESTKYSFKGDVCNCGTSRCNRKHEHGTSSGTEVIIKPKPNSAISVLPSAAILTALISVVAFV